MKKQFAVSGAMVGTLALLAACADQPTGLSRTTTTREFSNVSAAINEGELTICKATVGGDDSFTFDWSITNGQNGSVVLSNGQCATVASGISAKYTATVTEQAPPSNWDLTDITVDFNDGSSGGQIDVPNRTASANISNDRGALFTFTNTFTPPPPGPSCTFTQGYWKTHQELWDAAGEKVVTNSDLFFNSGKTYSQLYTLSAAGGNSYVKLAHQYIAAVLNLNGGSDAVIDAAVAQANALFAGHAAGSTFIKDAAWNALATTLDNYNNGVTGPGHCN
jgi:hypothetical protein